MRIVLSEQYMLAHQFDAAVKECNEAIRVDPEFPHSYFDLSENYEFSGDDDRAMDALEQGMRVAHENPARIEEIKRAYSNGGMNAVDRWQLNSLVALLG